MGAHDRLLSHPRSRVEPKTDAEIGAGVATDDRAEVERLRRRVAELEELQERYVLALEMVRNVSAAAVAGCGDRALDEVEVSSADRAVGF